MEPEQDAWLSLWRSLIRVQAQVAHLKVMSLLGGSAGPSMSSTAAETVIKDFVNFSPGARRTQIAGHKTSSLFFGGGRVERLEREGALILCW